MFNKSHQNKIDKLIERLSKREQSAIGDVQGEIQELKKEERSLEERLADIQKSYNQLLDGIDEHMQAWKELQDLKEKALTTITE